MSTVSRVLPWRRSSAPASVETAPLLASFRVHHPKTSTALISQAYELAAAAHVGQTRRSGEPYIHHPLSVAQIVADLGLDDVLATGGTAAATARLVEKLGGSVVGFGFLIELGFLGGRAALPGAEIVSLITYD